MYRSTLVLVVLVALVSAPARADDTAPYPGLAARGGATLSALPPLAPIGHDALGATDSGGGSILMSALYGGLAGVVVGAGIGLIEGDNYGRDIAIGAGVGILVGAAFGAAHTLGDSRGFLATDGLNTTERYPVLAGRTFHLGGRF